MTAALLPVLPACLAAHAHSSAQAVPGANRARTPTGISVSTWMMSWAGSSPPWRGSARTRTRLSSSPPTTGVRPWPISTSWRGSVTIPVTCSGARRRISTRGGTGFRSWFGGRRRIAPGRVCDETVCLVDLLATCADMAGGRAAGRGRRGQRQQSPALARRGTGPIPARGHGASFD